jgi:hypothetical protein
VPDVSGGVGEAPQGLRWVRTLGPAFASAGPPGARGRLCLLVALLTVVLPTSSAWAAPARVRARSASVATRPASSARAASSVRATRATVAAPSAPAAPPKPAAVATPAAGAPVLAEARISSSTTPAQGPTTNDVVKTEEARRGEKTYTFGAQEVEGRLKSPQILYFLRRVRAQFDPAPLGHRSFMLELSDTRRNPALE